MKRVRIANGVKRIDDTHSEATIFRLRDILNEHRSILINRITSDLVTYIDYRFKTKPGARQLDTVKDNLTALKNSVLDLERYDSIVDYFHQHEMTYIGNELFMQEIDENISASLNLPQLKLVE